MTTIHFYIITAIKSLISIICGSIKMAVNGDSVLFLVDELTRSWRELADAAFYLGALYGAYKLTQALLSALRGVRTYFIPLGRAVSSDLSKRFGEWAGG